MSDLRPWCAYVALLLSAGCGDDCPDRCVGSARPIDAVAADERDATTSDHGNPSASDAGREPRDAALDARDAAAQVDAQGAQEPTCGPDGGTIRPASDAGGAADRCIAEGSWSLSNLVPCIFLESDGTAQLYSSTPTETGLFDCSAPEPDASMPFDITDPWSDSKVRIACAGMFTFCYAIKAGDMTRPSADDCVIMQACQEVWYPDVDVDQALPPLPAWVASDTECAGRFVSGGGYGEMSVLGTTVQCDAVDDGRGNPFVFWRTTYILP